MKLRCLVCWIACGVALALGPGEVLSRDGGGGDGGGEELDFEEIGRLWVKYTTPGIHHRDLNYYVGEWDVTTKIWMNGSDAPPAVSNGTASCKWVLGGRFVQTDYAGLMKIEANGHTMELPVEGIGFTGYDNFKKKYVSVWLDNNNTAVFTSEGTYDPVRNEFTYFGLADEWMTGEHDKPFKNVDRIIDQDTGLFEMHDLSLTPGKTKIMEMQFLRKKVEPAS